MSSNPNSPAESLKKLFSERTVLSGIFLMCVTYGAHLMLYIATAHLLFKSIQRKSHTHKRTTTSIIIYVTLLFALSTIATGCAIQNTVWDWVDNRNYPGGPISFSLVDGKDPIYLTMVMCFNVMSILQDGYLLYRFMIIWGRNWLFFILPFLLYLSSIATSFLIWAEILISGAPFLANSHIDIGLINWVLSISTNFVLTFLIILRILIARRQSIRSCDSSEADKTYMSVANMLVESQSIYAIVGVVVLVGVKVDIQVVNVLANTFGILEGFAPTMVAYRVARGTAWKHQRSSSGTDNENQRQLSTLKFSPGTGTGHFTDDTDDTKDAGPMSSGSRVGANEIEKL